MDYTLIWEFTQGFYSTKRLHLIVKDAPVLPKVDDIVTMVVDGEHIAIKVHKIEHEINAVANKKIEDSYVSLNGGEIKIFGTRMIEPKE